MAHNIVEKFTSHLKQALLRARRLCDQNEINTEHLLEALAAEQGSIAAEILQKSTRQNNTLFPLSAAAPPAGDKPLPATIALSEETANAIIKAVQISQRYGHKYVGTEHVLKGLIDSRSPHAYRWWQKRQINLTDLEKNLHIVLESTSKFPDLTAVFRLGAPREETKEENLRAALEYFGRELTSRAVQKDIDPVIGRSAEIDRLVHILCRRYKNNPLLLGEAGVGKTAIVEGLAKKILDNEVPPILANKKIYAIDMGAMVAGTIYRGEFEARLKNLLEAAETAGNIILFIDEIHTIIGAGSASGSLDAANMLKPALARGRLSIIGATTVAEYKKHLETDSALERRLQPIIVNEPSDAETLEVLRGIKSNYEKFHRVTITEEALTTAVKLSHRYLTDKLQPDKAIDLLDEAAAKVKVIRSQKSLWQKIRKTEAGLNQVLADKKKAVADEAYGRAILLKQNEAERRLELEALLAQVKASDSRKTKVTAEHILEVVAGLTKIPLGQLQNDERALLMELEKNLQKKIVGQDQALSQIANLIRRSRTNVSDPEKPLASFLFLGPSGVGKTETAKQLAKLLFHEPKALIRVDMSEFAEGFTVSRLIGAPAGYVGYRDDNKFTDMVRRAPYSVVLLDEIEKAHPEVFNILLQVLSDGHLTDGTGRTVNFKNTIIIMTANVGLEEFNQAARLGFAAESEGTADFAGVENDVRRDLTRHFRQEFLNRIDNIIVFKPLARGHLKEIIELYLSDLNARLAEQGLSAKLTEAASEHILNQVGAPETGARGIRRFFQDKIESAIANLLLADKAADSAKVSTIKIDSAGEKLKFKAL